MFDRSPDRPHPGTISRQRFLELAEADGGFCIACGEPASGVEPDAAGSLCEFCGEAAVFAVAELQIRGLLLVIGEEARHGP
jgi:hypothetical protein